MSIQTTFDQYRVIFFVIEPAIRAALEGLPLVIQSCSDVVFNKAAPLERKKDLTASHSQKPGGFPEIQQVKFGGFFQFFEGK